MNTKGTTNRYVALACTMICCLTLGFIYAYSAFLPHIMEYFSMDEASASFPYTVTMAVFVLGNFVGGIMQSKMKPKIIMCIGFLLMAAGVLFTSFLPPTAGGLVWLTYGVLIGMGQGINYNVLVANSQKWFPDKRGFATGITVSVLGLSTAIMAPLANMWLKSVGLSRTFVYISVIFIVVGVVAVFIVKMPPEGYMMDAIVGKGPAVLSKKQYAPVEMLKTRTYYNLLLVMFCSIPAYVLISAVFVSIGVGKGMSSEFCVMGVSIASMVQVAGRFLSSTVSDKLGRKLTLTTLFVVTGISIILVMQVSGWAYIIAFCAISFCYGGFASTIPPAVTDYFGIKYAGVLISLVMVGMAAAALITPLVSKAVGITATFVISGVVAVVGILGTLLLPKKSE